MFIRIILGLAAMAVAVPAAAAQYEIRYTGLMARGLDETGVFTTANTSLTGLAFDLRYTLTYPGVGMVDANTPSQLALSGGSVVGAASPISAVLTINGRSISLAGTREARFERTNLTSYEGFNEFLEDSSVVGNVVTSRLLQTNFYGNSSNFLTTVDPAAGGLNFSLAGYRGTILANFGINDGFNTPVQGGRPFFTATQAASGTFLLQNFSQQLIIPQPPVDTGPGGGAVPEPASWTMLITGFGLVGTLARQRSRRRARVHA